MAEENTEPAQTTEEGSLLSTEQTPEQSSVVEPAQTTEEGSLLNVETTETEEVNELQGKVESYEEFTLPEKFAFDEEGLSEATTLFKELGLSQKGGQKVLDAFTSKVEQIKTREVEALAKVRKDWRAEVRNSENYATERTFAAKGLQKIVTTPEEKALFNNTWLSDHPAFFSMMAKVGRMVSEDAPLQANATTNKAITAEDRFPLK